jgi:type II secretory pathway component HofQ
MCQGEHDLQETALRSESQLESTRRSLIELDEDKQAGKEETESARWAFIPLYSLAF